MIIYLATSGEYSDYQVCHAFAKREDAESYKLGDDVKEMEVRDGPVEVRTWHTLNWRADWPEREAEAGFVAGNPHPWTERRDFDGDERRVEHTWSGGVHLNVQGWDPDLVRKVYSEQRAQFLAPEGRHLLTSSPPSDYERAHTEAGPVTGARSTAWLPQRNAAVVPPTGPSFSAPQPTHRDLLAYSERNPARDPAFRAELAGQRAREFSIREAERQAAIRADYRAETGEQQQ